MRFIFLVVFLKIWKMGIRGRILVNVSFFCFKENKGDFIVLNYFVRFGECKLFMGLRGYSVR